MLMHRGVTARIVLVASLLVTLASCPAPAQVTVETAVVYAQGAVNAHTSPGTNSLLLDVYRPSVPADQTGSALVLIHGGSFTSGSRTSPDMIDAANYFASRGWACFSIDYRLVADDPPAPPWIEALSNVLFNAIHAASVDTKRAIRWVRAHAEQYGCSSNQVAGLGHSAGAYCIVQAIITDEADFANDAGTPTPDQWAGHAGKLNAGIEVSGGTGLNAFEFDSGDPPLMVWHGDSDSTVPYSEAEQIHTECVDHRIPHRLFTLAGKDHGAATWTALYAGRGLKDHAFDFLNLFFDLRIDIAATSNAAALSWPSVSNAVYDVRATSDPSLPFTNAVVAAVTATADVCTTDVPGLETARFFRVGVRSGQPGE